MEREEAATPVASLWKWALALHFLLVVTSLAATWPSWPYLIPALDALVLLLPLIILSFAPRLRRPTVMGLTVLAVLFAFVSFGNGIMQNYFPRPLELATDTFLIGSLVDLAEGSGRLAWFYAGCAALALLTALWGFLLWYALNRLSLGFAGLGRNLRIAGAGTALALVALLIVTGAHRTAGFPARTSAFLVSQLHHFIEETRSFRMEDVGRVREEREALARQPGFLKKLGDRPVYVFLIEAYGEVVFGDPTFRGAVETTLAEFDAEVSTQGWHSRSGFMVSPVYGGNSWIADSAFACGIPVRTELRFRQLHELSLPCMAPLFGGAGWETISMRPATLRNWDKGDIYGFDKFIGGFAMRYFGPRYYWSPMPDQYALAWYQHKTLAEPAMKPGAPKLAYFQLTSSHAPFNRIPVMVDDWEGLISSKGQSLHRTMVYSYPYSWWDLKGAEEGYLKAINYDLTVIREYLAKYAPPRFLALILGDHQPASPITGERPFDVPIHALSDDPAIVAALEPFGLAPGMRPPGTAGGRPMHEFLDFFLRAYSDSNVSH